MPYFYVHGDNLLRESESESAILDAAAVFDQLPLLQEQLGDLLLLLIGVAEFGDRYTDGCFYLPILCQRNCRTADLSGGFLVFVGNAAAADLMKIRNEGIQKRYP